MGESILRYGIMVYGSCSHSRAKQIDKVLHRLSANILYGTNCDDLYTISKMRAAEVTSLHNLFMQVVVIRNYFSCKFKQLESKPRVLRSVYRYKLPKIYTHYGKRCRDFYVPFHFNQLPQEMLCFHSVKQLKSALKSWLPISV